MRGDGIRLAWERAKTRVERARRDLERAEHTERLLRLAMNNEGVPLLAHRRPVSPIICAANGVLGIDEIAELARSTPNSVKTTLSRARAMGLLIRIRPGVYDRNPESPAWRDE